MWHGKSGSPCNLIRKLDMTDFETNWLVYNEIPVSITHLTAHMNINDHLNLKLQAVHSPLSISYTHILQSRYMSPSNQENV